MQSVVDRSGVPADTIRSWERRHGFPNPARDAQNQRLYSEHDIEAILRLKEQTAQGINIKDALRLLPDVTLGTPRSAHLVEPSTEPLPPHRPAPRSLPPVVERVVDSLLQFDGATARSLLHSEMALRSPESVAFDSILPAIERLTREHDAGGAFGRECLHQILSSLFNASDPDHGRDRIVIARVSGVAGSPDGPLGLAHALAVSRLGFAAVWLGGNADIVDIQHVISPLDPFAVVLVADDARDTGTAERWWTLLDELPSLRTWKGRRLIASPQPPIRSGGSASESYHWLPPKADATRILLDPGKRDPIQIVSDQ